MSTIELIGKLYKDENYIKWNNYYNKKTIWQILGKEKEEMSHSRFLRWLLDSNETHDLGNFPIRQLLTLIAVSNCRSNTKNEMITQITPDMLSNKNILVIKTMLCEVPDRQSRYDVFIEIELNNRPMTIIIENKVTSIENQNQTLRYEEYSKVYKNPILIYLSIKERCISNKFICITYQDLLDYVIEPVYEKSINEKIKLVIEDYIRVLSRFENKKGEKVIMAVSKEEKELLKRIYDENSDLFIQMVSAISDELDDNGKEVLNYLTEYNMSKRVKWLYKGQPYNSKDLVLAIIKDQIISGKDIDTLSQNKMHSDSVVVRNAYADGGYTELSINDDVYYIRNCCPRRDVERLIKNLNIDVKLIEQ